MQHIAFIPLGVEIPEGVPVIGRNASVNGQPGAIVRLRDGWRVVSGFCCGEWAMTREKEWTCPSCGEAWHQGVPGLWVRGKRP